MKQAFVLGEVAGGGVGRAVAIGTFDGVHRGHQELFRRLVSQARERGLESVALTFDPHPLAVVNPAAAPPILTETPDKVALIYELGVDRVVVIPFDAARAGQSAADFVREVLVEGLSARLVLEGWNFSFGRGREGTPEVLADLGRQSGFGVEVLEPVAFGKDVVSSTAIRTYLGKGNVERAAEMLGRHYSLSGEVVRGDQRGRTLGYPTANITLPAGVLIPGHGVYAVQVRAADGGRPLAGEPVCGMANLGSRPTFGGGAVSLEVHLFDFDGDLYGRRLQVEFISKLRSETSFGSPYSLVQQLDQDAAAARHILRQQVR